MGSNESPDHFDVAGALEKQREEIKRREKVWRDRIDASNRKLDQETRDKILMRLAESSEPCVTFTCSNKFGDCLLNYRESVDRTCEFLSKNDNRFSCSWSNITKNDIVKLTVCYTNH